MRQDPNHRWQVLVVDGQPEVHAAVEAASAGLTVAGHPVELLHASTSSEARELVLAHPELAVILLDASLETPDAGLWLVRAIREELELDEVRLILHVDDAARAEQLDACDVNDFRIKGELEGPRLAGVLSTAIRSFEQLRQANSARLGLWQVIRSSSELMNLRSVGSFAAAVLGELTGLLGEEPVGLIFSHTPTVGDELAIAGVRGKYRSLLGTPVARLTDLPAAALMAKARTEKENQLAGHAAALYVAGPGGRDGVIYLEITNPLGPEMRDLLAVFSVSVGIGFDNVTLFERLQNLAYNDHLTHLPNRSRMLQMLDELPAERRADGSLALVYIDRFTELNDALGHSTGDMLLLGVAQRIREAVDPDVIVGRVGAGLYAILGSESQVDAPKLLATFDAPFDAGGYSVPVSAHVGVARMRDIQGPSGEAFKGASIAVNLARQDPANPICFYTRQMEDEGRQKIELLRDLRVALDQHQLMVFYQPQVLLSDRSVVGAEALIRWRRPSGEFVSPGRFIPLAEHSGLVIPIGDLVLWAACHQVAEWQREGLSALRIGVNVSAQQFHKADFVETVAHAIKESGVSPEWIELEITESAAMREVEMVIEVMQRLRELGVSVAIDDFGTGYSSLSYLQRLPADRLKVDQSFVRAMRSESEGGSIPKMVVDLAHLLGLTAIAEGVEEEFQADLLKQFGCEEGQGFYFSRPVESTRFKDWVTEQRRR